jgi:hypothetical protein
MNEKFLNIASQCRSTATSDLAGSIAVDDGSGTLRELLNDAAYAIEKALAQPTTGDYAMGYGEGFNDACKPKAQPEQEPVESCNGMPAYEGPLSKTQRKQLTQELNAPLTLNGVALYPQPEWVGLTVDELIDLERKHRSHESLTRAIEAKLKEKNA